MGNSSRELVDIEPDESTDESTDESDDNERRESIYALSVDKKWVQPTWKFPVFAFIYIGLAVICFFVNLHYSWVIGTYSTVAVAGLLYRIFYYAKREWLLYFIDLCFVTTIVLIFTLMTCHYNLIDSQDCSQVWLISVYIVCSGPVPGATFALQLPLTLHHPEAFESFFLHATPMWIAYCQRWKWNTFKPTIDDGMPSVGYLVWIGMSMLYLRWVVPYLIFLLIQPFCCEKIAGYETLTDGFLLAGATKDERLQKKRQDYFSFAPKILLITLIHAAMSTMGAAAGALTFQNWYVALVWMGAVQIEGVLAGFHFYVRSNDPDHEAPSFTWGFVRMGAAWVAVLVTYFGTGGAMTSSMLANATMLNNTTMT